jgi:hypothetical protein
VYFFENGIDRAKCEASLSEERGFPIRKISISDSFP